MTSIEEQISKAANLSLNLVENDKNLMITVKESDNTEITNKSSDTLDQLILQDERATAGATNINIKLNKTDKYFYLNNSFNKTFNLKVADNRKELTKDFKIEKLALSTSVNSKQRVIREIISLIAINIKINDKWIENMWSDKCLLIDVNYTDGSGIHFNSNNTGEQLKEPATSGTATITIKDQSKGKYRFIRLKDSLTFKNVKITIL